MAKNILIREPSVFFVTMLCMLFQFTYIVSDGVGEDVTKQKDWKKKDIRDYSDADLERLYEQWEEDDEPLPVDELPEWDPRKPQPQVDFNDPNLMQNPEALLQATKKGKTLMVFVKVTGTPTKEEAETITSIWQTGLWNSHIHCDRYPLGGNDDRFIFMFKDGAVAWEAKDFLVEQERCLEVTIEQKSYHGKYTEAYKKEQEEASKAKPTKKSKKKLKKKKSKSKKEEL